MDCIASYLYLSFVFIDNGGPKIENGVMLSANSFSQQSNRCSSNILSSPYGANQVQSNYADDMAMDGNLKGISHCQISNYIAINDAKSKNINSDGVQNTFSDNHDVWLPQPIYPLDVENNSEYK